jgi:hypothetical protein
MIDIAGDPLAPVTQDESVRRAKAIFDQIDANLGQINVTMGNMLARCDRMTATCDRIEALMSVLTWMVCTNVTID